MEHSNKFLRRSRRSIYSIFVVTITIVLTSLTIISPVTSGVSSFRVYDESRILKRLNEAPVSVAVTMTHRMGEPSTSAYSSPSPTQTPMMTVRQRLTQRMPTSPITLATTPISTTTVKPSTEEIRRPVRQQNGEPGPGRRRIRKVVKKVKIPLAEWNTEIENEGDPYAGRSSTQSTTDLLGNYEQSDRTSQLFQSSRIPSSTVAVTATESNKLQTDDDEEVALALHGITKIESVKESSSSPLDDDPDIYYNTDVPENYQKDLKYSSSAPYQAEQTDLQIGESSNPFVNSSTPIISEFENNHSGLQYKIQILHPLLNSDSVLSQRNPKIPENKEVHITHNLSEGIGEVPFAPDLRATFRVRKKQHPLLNKDSIISTEHKVSKNNGQFHHEVTPGTGGSRRKLSSQIRQNVNSDAVTIVQADSINHPRTSSTTYPPVTLQRSTTRQSTSTFIPTPTISTTTTRRRPTIRLTNPTTTTTTTTTQRPSTVVLSPVTYATTTTTEIPETAKPIDPERESQLGSPQVILFPPEGSDIAGGQNQNRGQNKPLQVPTPLSTEQEILNQLFGLGQSTPQAGNGHSTNPPTENNIFDLLNLFQPTAAPTTTTPRATTLGTTTTRRRTTSTTTAPLPASTPPPIQTEAELENLLQLAILDGLLKANGGSGNKDQKSTTKPTNLQEAINGLSDNDLQSIYSLIDNQGKTSPKPAAPVQQQQHRPVVTAPVAPAQPVTTASPIQTALSSMLSLLTNPFSPQQQKPQQQTNIFGQPQQTNLFGQPQQTNLFGQPQQTNLFGQQQQKPQPNLFGNLFGLNLPQQQKPQTNLFGQQPTLNLFGQPQTSLFGGQKTQRPGGLFGGNSLFNFNLNSDATSTTTSVQRPVFNPTSTTTTPKPNSIQAPVSSVISPTQEAELLNQLLLGIAADTQSQNQGKQNNILRSTPQPPVVVQQHQQKPNLDLQSLLSGNWLNALAPTPAPTRPQPESAPSETMQLLNILFNQNQNNRPQQQQKRTTGPYWWLDMNAFFGGQPTSDPMAGIRPKFGQRDYFLKVTR